jgi:hypothetical protein
LLRVRGCSGGVVGLRLGVGEGMRSLHVRDVLMVVGSLLLVAGRVDTAWGRFGLCGVDPGTDKYIDGTQIKLWR